MNSALRFTKAITQNVANATNQANGCRALLAGAKSMARQPSASITSVEKQDESFIRPAPFDYRKKRYTKLHRMLPFLDPTHLRMNPNSKIITVEGNIGSGKEKVAQELAKRFDMLYLPEPKIEDLYVNSRGFDYRTLDKHLPEVLHCLDEKGFYENPMHEARHWYKMSFFRIKYAQYYDALTHLFNTGQGVVMERSPSSDFVFADAMYLNGWMPKDVYDYYFRVRYTMIHLLLRPHLIIYLDRDAETALKTIKERNIPHEVNSKVLTQKYLQDIEDSYKKKYLVDAEQFSEMLTYKWNKPGNMDDMVLDIEKIDFEDPNLAVGKGRDWYFFWDSQWHNNRWTYTNNKNDFLAHIQLVPIYDVPSLECTPDEDWEHRDELYHSMVPDYCIEPQHDSNASWFKRWFGLTNYYQSEEYACRHPWM